MILTYEEMFKLLDQTLLLLNECDRLPPRAPSHAETRAIRAAVQRVRDCLHKASDTKQRRRSDGR